MLLNNSNYLEIATSISNSDIIVIPVMSDDNRHYYNTNLCAIFIKILGEPSGFILPINHNECENLFINSVTEFLSEIKALKYIYNKKAFIRLFDVLNTDSYIDIESLYYINNNKSLENALIPTSFTYQSKSEQLIKNSFVCDDMNEYVPIYKLEERLEKFSVDAEIIIVENKIDQNNLEYLMFLNKTIKELGEVEKNGMFVDRNKLLNHFPSYSKNISKDNLVYSNYNIYTATGRPSNTFDKLNFAALNKDDGTRSSFVSRFDNGFILMFDYDAYHLNLIANIVEYKFPDGTSIHDYLGKLYYGKDTLTEEEYNKSKEASFTILYGGFDDSVAKAIPYFGKVKGFIDDMWKSYDQKGYVESPISKKKFYKRNMELMTKNKLFNYMLQELETSRNILVMEKINNLLKTKNSKLILYLYLVFEIKSIMEDNGLYKLKTYFGKDLHNMKKMV